MKSEEFILQELEKEKRRKAAEEGQGGEPEKLGVKFMISGEAPVLMSKACELLTRDLSFRAWRHTERNRRRTLQRQDLHAAVGESEVYDFLIDIVPRVTTSKTSAPSPEVAAPPLPPGIPQMTAMPSTVPPMGVPNPGAQPQNMVDMQQMQLQTQQGVLQFPDQQQFQQNLMSIPQIPVDMGQTGSTAGHSQQWMSHPGHPVPNSHQAQL